ncbi:MAG TPA: LON peptidase substrate-binding domain-containing protein, partial [Pilimelia sp.]|nr:LON peptidase substrate-binding domain-containing protein [Pilimelia sp.]
AHPDGRFDVVAVGRRRFVVVGLDAAAGPYLSAEVRWLDEPTDAGAAALVPVVQDALGAYVALLRADPAASAEQLPADPLVLSYFVGATAQLTVADRQALLTAPDTATRLRLGRRLLSRECGLLRRVRAVPKPLAAWAHRPLPN